MFDRPALKKVGPLEVLDFGPENAPTVVMFHGYGADAYDLSSLRNEIRTKHPLRWIFPQGPLSVPIGPGYTGRAWFSIDMTEHERAAREETHVDYSKKSTERMTSSKQKALEMLKALDVPMEKLILGGFSQGSMLALELTLELPVAPRGLIIYSGTLVDEVGTRTRAKLKPNFPFFQSHGEYDQILGFQGAANLEIALTESGWDGALLAFDGGHELPPVVLRESSSYLQKILR